jgi:uncharacterized phage protein (TIGR01671 family)
VSPCVNMKREIKFRAFYREDKYWMTVTTLDFMKNADGSLPTLCDGFMEDGQHMHFGLHEVDLCQYSGLHDKNGKEIYEGDILQDVAKSNHVVVYDKGHYIVRHDNGTGDFIAPINKFEVIGNIYTNLELVGADIG